MNYKTYPVGVHINENSVKVLSGIVQNDNGNLFQVQLYDGTKAYDFTGYTIINATIIRPDETALSDMWPVNVGSDEMESHTFLAIQDIDAKNGRISFTVGGDATVQAGLHRMAIEIYSDTVRVTTARINYVVVETLDQEDSSILENSEGYYALQSLIMSCSNIVTDEQERANQEVARAENEEDRQVTFASLVEEYNTKLAELQGVIDRAVALFDQALAQGQLEELEDDLEQTFTVRMHNIDLSQDGYINIPNTSGTPDAWFATHETPGALLYSNGSMYVGTGEGEYERLCMYQPYVVSTTAPADLRSLWIDSANGNALKCYVIGEGWQEVKTVAMFG